MVDPGDPGTPARLESEDEVPCDSNGDEEKSELENLRTLLKVEKEERRRAVGELQEEFERDLHDVEQKWMEKCRKLAEERDDVAKRMDEFEEKIDTMKRQVHRSETYKMEIEEANQRLRLQFNTLQTDYEDTMQERSIVLEENSRLIEEKEKLQKELEKIKCEMQKIEAEEVGALKKKLEHTRRLLQVNMEETVNANAKRDAALSKMMEAEQKSAQIAEERDEALRRCQRTSHDHPIIDVWNTHSVQINLPFPKPNLGILLGGGRTDDGSIVHGPIYVKHVAHGSPFETLLRKLDHIVMVNDISVTDMDERSVMGMLSNSHNIHLVIRRRANSNRIVDVCLPLNYGIGLELANGVFINSCEPNGAASRSGLQPGQRVVHVMNIPVYDAKHAELLIKNAREPLTIGILQSTKRGNHSQKEKARPTIFSRWFGRTGGDKERNVVAKANIDRRSVTADLPTSLLRQGSLRMPQASSSAVSPLVRYGSLRVPTYSMSADHSKLMLDALDTRFNVKSSTHSEIAEAPDLVFAGTNIDGVPVYIPKSTMYSTPASPVGRVIRQSDVPSQHRSTWDGRSFSSATTTSDATRPYSMHFTSSTADNGKPPRRTSVYSPTSSSSTRHHIPHHHHQHHPPPYPSIRDDSLSSVMSSNNSIRQNFSNNPNRHCVSKEGSDFSLSTTGSTLHTLDSRKGKRGGGGGGGGGGGVLLVNRSSQPRLVEVSRNEVRLCGGNAIGILAESAVGVDLLEGDLILEIDGNNVRNMTLESAVNTLWADDDEICRLLVQDGGDRLNRLRLGADGDSFYLRVNIDRSQEQKDELELKSGDVVFVDKTIFMGKKGRWRAWKLDKEGRQREHGAIPSSTSIYQSIRLNRNSSITPSRAYEWVEKLDTKIKRPVVLFGPLIEPFLQLLVDDSEKFSTVSRESLTASVEEVTSLLREKVLIDSKQNEEVYDLYHVISSAQIFDVITQGLHCILHVDPSAIERLKRCRIFPIIIKIRFKSVKQLKDVNEHICGEKISSKEAKQLIEKDLKTDKELENAVTLIVPNHNNVSFLLTHSVLQLKKLIDEEQKKTVWVTRKIEDE